VLAGMPFWKIIFGKEFEGPWSVSGTLTDNSSHCFINLLLILAVLGTVVVVKSYQLSPRLLLCEPA